MNHKQLLDELTSALDDAAAVADSETLLNLGLLLAELSAASTKRAHAVAARVGEDGSIVRAERYERESSEHLAAALRIAQRQYCDNGITDEAFMKLWCF